MAVSLAALKVDFGLEDLKSRFGKPDKRGYSLARLSSVAESYGLKVQMVRTSLGNLERRKQLESFACICWVAGNHYVVCADSAEGVVTVVDPPEISKVSSASFMSQWTGECLIMSKSALTPELSLETGGHLKYWLGALFAVCLGVFAFRMVRKRQAMIGIAFLAILSTTSEACRSEDPQPIKVHLSKLNVATLNVGNFVLGSEANVRIALVNDSSHTLHLNDVSVSCSCVGVRAQKKAIAVGEEHEILVGLSTQLGGNQQAAVTLSFAEEVPLKFGIAWCVTHSLVTEPTSLFLGRVETAGTNRLEFVVKRVGEDGRLSDAKLTSVRTSLDVLTCTYDGGTVKLELTDCGREKAEIGYVYVQDEGTPKHLSISLPVSWRKPSPDFVSLPGEFALINSGGELSFRVLLTALDSKLAEIESVSAVDSELKVRQFLVKSKRENRCMIHVEFEPPRGSIPAGPLSVRVKFSDGRSVDLLGRYSQISDGGTK